MLRWLNGRSTTTTTIEWQHMKSKVRKQSECKHKSKFCLEKKWCFKHFTHFTCCDRIKGIKPCWQSIKWKERKRKKANPSRLQVIKATCVHLQMTRRLPNAEGSHFSFCSFNAFSSAHYSIWESIYIYIYMALFCWCDVSVCIYDTQCEDCPISSCTLYRLLRIANITLSTRRQSIRVHENTSIFDNMETMPHS